MLVQPEMESRRSAPRSIPPLVECTRDCALTESPSWRHGRLLVLIQLSGCKLVFMSALANGR